MEILTAILIMIVIFFGMYFIIKSKGNDKN